MTKTLTDVLREAADKERAEERKRQQKEALRKTCGQLVGALIMLPVIAAVLMFAVGAVHGFAPAVPAIGYGTTILLVLGADALSLVTKKFRK